MVTNNNTANFAILVLSIQLLFACSSPTPPSNNADTKDRSIRVPTPIASLNVDNSLLSAYIKIDNNDWISLTIDSQNGFVGDIDNVTTGQHDFFIKFEYHYSDSFPALLIAEAHKTITISPSNKAVSFTDSDYEYDDYDNDTVESIDEIRANSDPTDFVKIPLPGTLWRWQWVSGDSTHSQPPNYGIKGVADPNNRPGARRDSIAWRDGNDHLWFFGGKGFTPDGASFSPNYNDLWRWDGNNWTWVAGTNLTDSAGIYGVKGEPSTQNYPGAREDAVSWMDSQDQFWLFGGLGHDSNGDWGVLNDLWRWDGSQWTWMSGSNLIDDPGNYGSLGVTAATNQPSAREDAIAWLGPNDTLWFFGGLGFSDETRSDNMNDLWKWENGNWTWVSGSNLPNQAGNYEQTSSSAANIPGAREDSIAWADYNGVFWLFGGVGYDSVGDRGRLNDLWRWDGSQWTWVSGESLYGELPSYGQKGVVTAANNPGARTDGKSWVTADNSLWLMGGWGRGRGSSSSGYLSDIWRWDGEHWTWVSGNDATDTRGQYNEPNTPSFSNIPGARADSIVWVDSNDRVWIYGGEGYDINGDSGVLGGLWVFAPSL